jgi:tripeptide aminopeptidase
MHTNLTDYFISLVKIDSESRNERAIVDKLIADLTELGFEVSEDSVHDQTGGNAGNVYAYLPGKVDKKPILFCSHVDTVRPGNGIKPKLDGKRIVSDGSTILGADDKSGVAEILWGIKNIINSDVNHAPIEVLFTVCEEVGLLGARYFDKSKLKSAFGYAFDSQDIGEFMIGAPSQNSLKVTVFGKEAHAGVEPEKGINAIRIAAEAIAKMPMGRIDFETTCSIGIINGGMATNIVPNRIDLQGEVRSHNMDKLENLTRQIITTFEEAAAAHQVNEYQGRVEIHVHNEYQSFYMDDDTPVVQTAKSALDNLGLKPDFIKGGGGSDANIIIAEGVPMIVAGTGMYRYHTVEEYIDVCDLEKGADLVYELIKVYSLG